MTRPRRGTMMAVGLAGASTMIILASCSSLYSEAPANITPDGATDGTSPDGTQIPEGGADATTILDGAIEGGDGSTCSQPTTAGCACGVVCASGQCSNGGCDPLVFVTRSTFPAVDVGGAADPTARADARCQEASLALRRTPLTKFSAWLSASGKSVAGRFVRSSRPYRLNDVGHSLVARDFEGLASDLLHRIDVADDGSVIQNAVWTGTNRDGTSTASSCMDWSSTVSFGSTGRTSSVTAGWSYDAEMPCSGSYHLYCFEQVP